MEFIESELHPERKPGSNITILNTIYVPPRKDDSGIESKWLPDRMYIIYKDLDTGKKNFMCMEKPDYTWYLDENPTAYPRLFAPVDELTPITCPLNRIEQSIAKETNNMEFFKHNIQSGNRDANRALHDDTRVFNSDMNPSDWYRMKFAEKYENQLCSISKAYFDIEADTIHMAGDFPEMGECPVNAVTLILQDQMKAYTFLLRNKNNPQVKEFEDSISDKLFSELKAFIEASVNGPDHGEFHNLANKLATFYDPSLNDTPYKSYGLDKLDFNFLFYDEDDEIKMIQDLFGAINSYQPDFALAWNMGFDVPYLKARIEKLGYTPESIMCHPDFPDKSAIYFIDERVLNEWAERGDKATISSYTVYLDQLIQFASRRKGQNQFTSYSLDSIGEAVAGVGKLDYKQITTSISELPYKDYKTFVFYNIMDVIVQYCIEHKTNDIDYVFNKALVNNTRYSKAHRQTVYLTNRGAKEFKDQGFIIGNNHNRGTKPPDKKFPGAFVADPSQVNDTSRVRIDGHPVNLFDNLDDFDYSSLYPSVMRQFNMAPNTQIAMVEIPDKIHDNENRRNDEKWSRAEAFMEDFQSNEWIEFCSRWLAYPTFSELVNYLEHYFTEKCMPGPRFRSVNTGKIVTIEDVRKINEKVIFDPIVFGPIHPIEFNQPMQIDKAKELIKKLIDDPNQSFFTNLD